MDELNAKCEELYTNHNKLTHRHNDLLLRVINVTDDVLQEQLREEYLTLEEKLKISELELSEFKKIYMAEYIKDWALEVEKFYEYHFVESSLANELARQGLNIDLETKKLRMRPIGSLRQSRELCMLLNTLNKKIIVLNYLGNVVETIGKGCDVLKIHCRGISPDLKSIVAN
jgi:hypothetical protein